MLKHIYRAIILIAIFVASLSYFSKDIKEVVFDIDNTTTMTNATFPLVTIKTGDCTINMLHGYSSNMAANKIREAVTPLGTDQTFEVLFVKEKLDVKKLNYEVREFVGNELIESDSISVFEENEAYQSAKIKLNAELSPEKEYAVKITLVTSKSVKIYYYHRIKIYDDAHLKSKLDFIMGFHNAMLNKTTAQSMIKYLESSNSADNTSLAYVNINSSFDLVSWGKLNPKLITDVVPVVKEIYEDTASIELNYFIEADVAGAVEHYRVTEFFRVRYSTDRMYLLNYERHMESIFDINLASTAKSELKLGITSNMQIPYMPSADSNKLAFVRDGDLWFYDMQTNEITRIFSFQQKVSDYTRDMYDQHDIRVLNMDAEGNIDFLVYGYMNRGQYEGRVAVILYRYIRAENRIEEQVYIPAEEPYQSLKEKIGELSYVNAKEVFYIHIYNSIYAYDLITRHLSVIASNVDKKQVVVLPGTNSVVWQENSDPKASKRIQIMNLETGEKQSIKAAEGYNIRLMDKIDSNIVYGYVKNNNIGTMMDGSIMAPLSSVEIASTDKKVLKTYKKKGYFVTGVSVKDNVLELRRIKKVDDNGTVTYVAAPTDYIMNQVKTEAPLVGVSQRISEQTLTEYYMTLPNGFVMQKKPTVLTTVNTVISQDPTVRLPVEEQKHLYYYPYVTGGIAGSYESAADAIAIARDRIGVVLNSNNQLVWERGLKATEKTISRFDTMSWSSGSGDTIENCIKLMLAYQGVNVPLDELNVQNSCAYEVFKKHSKYTPVRLTGITMEDAFYYISMGRPVLGMTDSSHAVLIYGYDAFNIMVIDPSRGNAIRLGIQDSTRMFESAGNIFISYLEQ